MPDYFNPYESMSTAELQALLKEDSEKAAAIACDLEAIMEITEVQTQLSPSALFHIGNFLTNINLIHKKY